MRNSLIVLDCSIAVKILCKTFDGYIYLKIYLWGTELNTILTSNHLEAFCDIFLLDIHKLAKFQFLHSPFPPSPFLPFPIPLVTRI